LAVSAGAWCAGPARADEIHTESESHPRGKLVSFRDGKVTFRTPDRALHHYPIESVERLLVDDVTGLKNFNEAESYVSQNQFVAAAVRYERALREAREEWVPLIRVRLFQARDRAGQFDKAVVQFIHLADEMPRLAARMMPTSLPTGPDEETRQTLERIDGAIARHGDDYASTVLMLLRFAVLERVDRPTAMQMARDIAFLPVSVGSRDEPADASLTLQLTALDMLLEQQRRADVVEAVNRLISSASDELLPSLLLLKGRAVYMEGVESGNTKDFMRAGLVFMRVVIHYPKDARAADALYWSARVHEQIERPTQAVRLLRECLDRQDVSDTTRSAARTLLKRLTA
jgi:hypothetical protein